MKQLRQLKSYHSWINLRHLRLPLSRSSCTQHFGFLLAGSATVILLSANAGWIFESRIQGLRALLCFGLLYALIYMLLRLEDNALLVGAVASFLAVATAMYFTREIDWYSQLAGSGTQEQRAPLLAPKGPA